MEDQPATEFGYSANYWSAVIKGLSNYVDFDDFGLIEFYYNAANANIQHSD